MSSLGRRALQLPQIRRYARGDLRLLMHERRYFRRDKRLSFTLDGRQHDLIPDAGFLLRSGSPTDQSSEGTFDHLHMNFVEFDNGSLSTARLAAKYRAYTQWPYSEGAQQYLAQLKQRYGGANDPPNFRLLVIAHGRNGDKRRLAELFALALELPRPMRDRIWLTTIDDLKNHHDDGAPLDAPLWLRVRDGRRWLPAFKALSNSRTQGAYVRQRAFVAGHLSTLPLHALLPRRLPELSIGDT